MSENNNSSPVSDDMLQAQIVLLKQALEFYANENNYSAGTIERDKGHVAKHSLNLVKNVNDQMVATKDSYETAIKKMGESFITELKDEVSQDDLEAIRKLDAIMERLNGNSKIT